MKLTGEEGSGLVGRTGQARAAESAPLRSAPAYASDEGKSAAAERIAAIHRDWGEALAGMSGAANAPLPLPLPDIHIAASPEVVDEVLAEAVAEPASITDAAAPALAIHPIEPGASITVECAPPLPLNPDELFDFSPPRGPVARDPETPPAPEAEPEWKRLLKGGRKT